MESIGGLILFWPGKRRRRPPKFMPKHPNVSPKLNYSIPFGKWHLLNVLDHLGLINLELTQNSAKTWRTRAKLLHEFEDFCTSTLMPTIGWEVGWDSEFVSCSDSLVSTADPFIECLFSNKSCVWSNSGLPIENKACILVVKNERTGDLMIRLTLYTDVSKIANFVWKIGVFRPKKWIFGGF